MCSSTEGKYKVIHQSLQNHTNVQLQNTMHHQATTAKLCGSPDFFKKGAYSPQWHFSVQNTWTMQGSCDFIIPIFYHIKIQLVHCNLTYEWKILQDEKTKCSSFTGKNICKRHIKPGPLCPTQKWAHIILHAIQLYIGTNWQYSVIGGFFFFWWQKILKSVILAD